MTTLMSESHQRSPLSNLRSVFQIMSVIQVSEDEVMVALYDCDYDADKAASMLLEGEAHGEWETSGKKKKNRLASTLKEGDVGNGRSPTEAEGMDADPQPLAANQDRERSRGRGGGAPRLRGRGGVESRARKFKFYSRSFSTQVSGQDGSGKGN